MGAYRRAITRADLALHRTLNSLEAAVANTLLTLGGFVMGALALLAVFAMVMVGFAVLVWAYRTLFAG